MTRSTMPLRRSDLDLRQVGTETIAYDAANDVVSSLTADAATVLAACDGVTTYASIAAQLGSPVVDAALTELSDAGLLVGSSRRTLLKRTALVGAGAMVVSMAAPLASASASVAATSYDLYTTAATYGGAIPAGAPFTYFDGSGAAPSAGTAVTTATPAGFGNGSSTGFYTPNATSTPFFVTNTTSSSTTLFDGTLAAHSFGVHPPQSTDALIRFVAPASAGAVTTYSVSASADSITTPGTSNGVSISVVNSAGQNVSGTSSTYSGGAPAPASLSVTGLALPADKTLYLVVNNNGNFNSDSTRLTFTITLS